MARSYEYKVGDTKPTNAADLVGFFPTVDLTGGAIVFALERLDDGTTPFTGVDQDAAIVKVDASGTRVSWTPATAWADDQAGDYVGWFSATLDGQSYRAPAVTLRVTSTDRTPSDHPFIYGDGRGGYASLAEVLSLIRNADNFSKFNQEAIEEILGDTAVELDAVLETVCVVPIARSQPLSWARVRLIHKYWAVGGCYDALMPLSRDVEKAAAAAAVWRDKGAQLLDQVVAGDIVLKDATPAGATPSWPQGTGATISDALDPDIDPHHTPIFSVDNMDRGWRLE